MKYLFKILLVLLLTSCISYSKVYDSSDSLVIGTLHNYIDHTSKLLLTIDNIKCMSNSIKFTKLLDFSGTLTCSNGTNGIVNISMVNSFNGTGTATINDTLIPFIIK